jgi:hypothetical protein
LVVIYLPFGKLRPQKETLALEGLFRIPEGEAAINPPYRPFFFTTRFSLISTWTPHSGQV